jgi:hypothetical protein
MELMTFTELKSFRIKPSRGLVAFRWIPPFLKSGLILPENYSDMESHIDRENSLRVGRFYIGEVFACGEDIKELKVNDKILVHEYSIRNYKGGWDKDEVYFLEEIDCKCKVDKVPEKGYIDMRAPISEGERKHLADY